MEFVLNHSAIKGGFDGDLRRAGATITKDRVRHNMDGGACGSTLHGSATPEALASVFVRNGSLTVRFDQLHLFGSPADIVRAAELGLIRPAKRPQEKTR